MNEQQIEAAAKRLCELRGVRPTDPSYNPNRPQESALEAAYSEVRRFYQVAQAIDHALGGTGLPE